MIARFTARFSCCLLVLLTPICGRAQQESARSLTLPEALDLALKNNRSILIARQDTRHFEQLKEKARADYFPKITNASTVSYLTDRQGIVLPAGSFSHSAATGLIPAETLRIDQGASATYYSRTQIAQPLTQLFAIRQENRAAAADVRKAGAKEESARIDAVANVHKLYYQALSAEKQKMAAETEKAAAGENVHEIDVSQREGASLHADLLKAQANAAEASSAVMQAHTAEQTAMLQLKVALGLPLDAGLHLVEPDVPAETGLPAREQAMVQALAQEPKLKAAQQDVEKAKAGVRAAKDAYIPDVTAAAHESYQSGIAFFDHNFGVFAGQVSIDLFDGGKRRAQVRAAEAELAESELALAEQQEQTRAAVEVTYDQVDDAREELLAKRLALDASREKEREATSSFQRGELLPSQHDMARAATASAEASVLEATLNLLLARVQVQRVIGVIPR